MSSKPNEAFSEVIEVTDPSDLEAICRLRAEVWSETTGQACSTFPDGSWRDEHDSISRHWVVRSPDGSLLAAARWTLHDSLLEISESEEYTRYDLPVAGPVAAPARVVVRPAAQGRGLALRLLDAQDQASRDASARYAVRQASPTMVRLLERRGWKVVGPASPDLRFPGVAFTVTVFDYTSELSPAATGWSQCG